MDRRSRSTRGGSSGAAFDGAWIQDLYCVWEESGFNGRVAVSIVNGHELRVCCGEPMTGVERDLGFEPLPSSAR